MKSAVWFSSKDLAARCVNLNTNETTYLQKCPQICIYTSKSAHSVLGFLIFTKTVLSSSVIKPQSGDFSCICKIRHRYWKWCPTDKEFWKISQTLKKPVLGVILWLEITWPTMLNNSFTSNDKHSWNLVRITCLALHLELKTVHSLWNDELLVVMLWKWWRR